MIKQECIGIPDMILLLMIFLFQKKIKAEIVLSPGGAYFFLQKFHKKNQMVYWLENAAFMRRSMGRLHF